MNPKFFVDSYGALRVKADGDTDTLIVAKFMQSENKVKATEYLFKIAIELTALCDSDPGAAGRLLAEAENKVHQAQLAEKFLEPVEF